MVSIRRSWTTLVFIIVILKNEYGHALSMYGVKCGVLHPPCEPKSLLVCTGIAILEERKCLCKEGLIPSKNRDGGTDCVPDRGIITTATTTTIIPPRPSGYKGPCSANQGCARGFACIKSTCDCPEGFFWSSSLKFCKPVSPPEVPCNPESTPNECDQLGIGNYECNEKDKVCRCPKRSEYAPEFKACKLKGGEDCYFVLDNNQQVIAHDLCVSQHCNNHSISSKCACKEDGGRVIWSLQHKRCIGNYFGFGCKQNSDCVDSMLNSQGRVDLICNTAVKLGRCECPTGRSFSKGYCITTTALYKEPCDPTERKTTCKTDNGTLLTCQQEEGGTGQAKCACLIKDVSARVGRKGASTILYWDSKNKICDLAPDDERCTANYQCKNGRCMANKCRSKSYRGQASGQNFLAIPIIFGSLYSFFLLV